MKMKQASTAAVRRRIREEILSVAEEGKPFVRREVNRRVAARFGLSQKQLADNTPNSRKNLLFSAVGTLLSDLVREGALLRSAEGRYTLTGTSHIAVQASLCRSEILSFCQGGTRSRAEIYAHLEAHFGTKTTETAADDHALRSLAGSLLDRLVLEGELVGEDGSFRRVLPRDECFAAEDTEALRARFLELLHRQGGAFLERFAVTLLSEYYARTGRTVTYAEVSGGSQDGGIDGRLDTVDALGFRETVLLQTKCRKRDLHVTEREVRGFYGALCAAGGSRGIFVTTSYFHEGALAFFRGVSNCVGIGGDTLFEIACECRFGIQRTSDGLLYLDRKVFSESQ